MQIRNSKQRYGLIAMIFHWLIAVMIVGMLALGLYMVRLSDSPGKFEWYDFHKSLGITILMLAIFRISWRYSGSIPLLPNTLLKSQKCAAKFSHLLLYFFMFLMPLTGWFMSSLGGYPTSFFGWFTLPDVFPVNQEAHHFLEKVHEFSAYALITLIIIHVAAALQHHLIYKDDVLKRMLPFSKLKNNDEKII